MTNMIKQKSFGFVYTIYTVSRKKVPLINLL